MAAKMIDRGTYGKQHWTGLEADTTAFLLAYTTLPNGSTYREVNGQYRLYELLNGIWHPQ